MGNNKKILSDIPADRWFAGAVNVFFVLSLITVYQWMMLNYDLRYITKDWCVFEILTNYEAGFIRRGLLGQILYWTAEHTHINIRILIPAFLIPPWIFVGTFMICKFKKYGIRWWLLAIIGYTMLPSIIRKDFIIYALFISVLYIYRSRKSVCLRISAMSLVSVIMLLIYEPAMFMSLGFIALLVIRDKSLPKAARTAYPGILCATILILLKSTGCAGIGHSIYDSWLKINPDGFAICDLVINSLDWSLSDSIRYNHGTLMPEFHLLFLIRYVFLILLIPYIYISYMYVDTYPSSRGFPYRSSVYTTLYLFFMLCMLPMWVGLSCDYGRMLYHTTISSLCVAFILPEDITVATFPQWVKKAGAVIDCGITHIPRSIYSITLLLLIFTPAYSFYYTTDYSPKLDSLFVRVIYDTCDFISILISHILP